MRILTIRTAMMLAGTGLLAGCGFISGPGPAVGGDRPQAVRVSGVPFHAQAGLHCGPAAMASLLGWTGLDITPASLEGRFYGDMADPRPTLVDTARHFGRLAYPIAGQERLDRELAAGHPVLILENLGVAREPLWNCPVAVGYEGSGDTVLVHAGDQAAKPISTRLLDRLWSDSDQWGLVVLRPGEMPATASESDMVAAAKGLEKAGHYWEAVLSYDTVLSQWPNDTEAQMGLGASLYLLGDLHGAADAYRAAAASARDPHDALAALDQVLAEMAHTTANGPHRPAVVVSPLGTAREISAKGVN